MSETLDRNAFDSGEVIFNKGDAPNCAFLIQSGAVDIVLNNGNRKTVVDTLEPGEFFGEMALVDNEPRSASAVARAPPGCRIIILSFKCNALTLYFVQPFGSVGQFRSPILR